MVRTGACADCGGRCVLRPQVKDGVVIRLETDDGEDPQLRACVRGRAYRKRVYDPNRLKTPLKRVGARGEGRFEPITWDEALDTVANELRRIKENYGNSAILLAGHSGSPGQLHGPGVLARLLNMFGGYTAGWGGASCESSTFGSRSVYGTQSTGNTQDDIINSRLIIMWGWNPANSIFSTNTSYYLALAKEAGAKIICVDPRYTDSVATYASQWIPIYPDTDAAMLIAMAYVIITNKLQDQKFLDTYTMGFDRYRDYVLGKEDGIPKTPAWAESITGVPAPTIENLAREYATTKPAALMAGFSPGRTACGEQYHRAAATLAAMTANIGIHGGSAAGMGRGPVGIMVGRGITPVKNPVEEGAPHLSGSLDTALRNRTRVHYTRLWDAILEGKAGGFPSDVKMLYILCGNPVNQFPNSNKAVTALQNLEFIVAHELFMTPTARFADILLPATSIWEREDLTRPWLSGPYYIYMNKVIEPLYESKSDLQICTELAPRLGVTGYNDKTDEQWLREIVKSSPDLAQDIPDFDTFKRQGVHKMKLSGPLVAFEKQIQDPENNPFPTPSGKIEIYSQRMADLNSLEMPPIPKYIETWEGRNDPLTEKYPLQLITFHFKTRAHSSFDNIPWLKHLESQTVWISSSDAQARGIRHGDEVTVFNDRGQVSILAKVTERIMPGVVAIGQGAWYRPDNNGIDRGGCGNVLTRDYFSPGGAHPYNTSLVQVQKV